MLMKNKGLAGFRRAGAAKKRGTSKLEDSFAMLLKTHVEKMSLFSSLAMLLKVNELSSASRDVDDTKGCYGFRGGVSKLRAGDPEAVRNQPLRWAYVILRSGREGPSVPTHFAGCESSDSENRQGMSVELL